MPRETPTAFSRALRQVQTPAEARLWQALRSGRLEGCKFRRQHPVGPGFADFACEALMVVIELDGGVHDDDEQVLTDHLRQQHLETLGWSVLRFPTVEVTARLADVLDAIRDHAKLARP